MIHRSTMTYLKVEPTTDDLEDFILTQSEYDSTENSLEETAPADLIKQTKAELGILPSAVEQQDTPKDATLRPSTRRSLFKDQDSVQQKCIGPVQEAKSGGFIAQIRKYLTPAKRQRLSVLHTRATLVRGLMSEVTLMVGQIGSRPAHQRRRKKVSTAARIRRNKVSSLTLLAAFLILLQKQFGDIKGILN
ncbi:uncharacterized protein LOC124871093 isoform X2 [Girardinichthys multiradiatus]|uniref:uncharacterized protein LOC124871093 isoform X2 n=1 Tax=Girardinichthys multiradiatus TaxID=208333 RepID=UPI001FABDC35|nr:uncharacterized protein LOC124871093 isoform X2 [Girardinichthys multiradiatus]XP_047226049.1 uncharacterized protein LOC124871093 isoform X2 [Girardinichthys multiradiatus]